MKGKGTTANDEMKFQSASDFFVIYKRFPSSRGSICVVGTQCTSYQTVKARMSGLSADVIEVQIPDSMRDPAGRSTFDVQVVLFGNRINPFTSKSNVTLNSRMMLVNARTAATQLMTLEAASIRNYELDSLSIPVNIQMRTCADCAIDKEATKNKTTGTYFSNVCGAWNATRSTWTQFHVAFTDLSLWDIRCETRQLVSEFAIIRGIVGCDNKASDNPAVNNACLKCNGGNPTARQGICDHLGVPCLLAADRCPLLRGSGKNACPENNPDCCLDACYVCGGKNTRFREEKFTNESGLCDFTGKTCPEGKMPTWIAVTFVAEATLQWTIVGTTPQFLQGLFATPAGLRGIRSGMRHAPDVTPYRVLICLGHYLAPAGMFLRDNVKKYAARGGGVACNATRVVNAVAMAARA